MTVAYAIHKLDAILTPANAAYSALELQHQLKDSGATALFTCIPLLDTALEAVKGVGIPRERVFILDMPEVVTGGKRVPFKSADDLIEEGKKLPAVESLRWKKGQGATQTAFLCYSSGTSGLPVRCGKSLKVGFVTNPYLERCHDFPSQRYHKCIADHDIRDR
jgi:acyl-CoA synthetase (AMP-forming)/AMP-acid ligase II